MGALNGKRILFVDDRPDVIDGYMVKVEVEGGVPTYTSRIESGLQLILDDVFDLAVVDLHMPIPRKPWPMRFEKSIRAIAEHESAEVRKNNSGQIVGHYITTELQGQPPYLYLSNVASYYRSLTQAPLPKGLSHFDKYTTTPTDLVRIIADFFAAVGNTHEQ